MRLPEYLSAAIEQWRPHAAASPLTAASRQLTERYKNAQFTAPAVRHPADRSAYLSVRFPATFAANVQFFLSRRRAANIEVSSLLDLGAGPGTSLSAAAEIFPELRHATLLEADPQWIQFGKKLAAQSPLPAVRETHWFNGDRRDAGEFLSHNAVVIS